MTVFCKLFKLREGGCYFPFTVEYTVGHFVSDLQLYFVYLKFKCSECALLISVSLLLALTVKSFEVYSIQLIDHQITTKVLILVTVTKPPRQFRIPVM